MSTDAPSPATPAPTDRGDRMSTPTPDRSQWSVTVTVPSDLPGAMRDSLFGLIANAAHLWEPSTRDGWDVDVSAGPAASAPQGDTAREVAAELAAGMTQIARLLGMDVEAGEVSPIVERVRALVRQGDTADVIERAVESLKATASELHSRPVEEMNEDWADRMVEGLAAAGLLTVAASPAPESLDLEVLAGVCRAYVSAWDDRHADSTVLGSLAGRVALAASPAALKEGQQHG